MGIHNRERRKAKQRAARERLRRQAPHNGPGPGGWTAPAPTAPEIIEQVLDAALVALHRREPDELARCRALLVDGPLPGDPAGPALVDQVLVARLAAAVARTWQHGWQPADLARLARREHGARHARMIVDMIAAALRPFAAATVDERWQVQLAELGAAVWWGDDGAWPGAWAGREAVSREAALGCALETLYLVSTVPPIGLLCPPPGQARRGSLGAAARAGRAADSRMLDRVRALLAKAESTTFPEEAEAYTAKAQELMARHSIDYALLAAAERGPGDEPAGRRIGVDNPYEAPKVLLLDAVARANRCRTVWGKTLGFVTVFGFPTDLDAVELLHTSLLVQATAAMVHAGSRRDAAGRSSTRSFRQSFLTAYAHRIGQRLADAARQASREVSEQTGDERHLPVLAAREERVAEAVSEHFPRLVSHSVPANNREGWYSGLAAADQACLQARQQVSPSR